jgi:hypothetical protein
MTTSVPPDTGPDTGIRDETDTETDSKYVNIEDDVVYSNPFDVNSTATRPPTDEGEAHWCSPEDTNRPVTRPRLPKRQPTEEPRIDDGPNNETKVPPEEGPSTGDTPYTIGGEEYSNVMPLVLY